MEMADSLESYAEANENLLPAITRRVSTENTGILIQYNSAMLRKEMVQFYDLHSASRIIVTSY